MATPFFFAANERERVSQCALALTKPEFGPVYPS